MHKINAFYKEHQKSISTFIKVLLLFLVVKGGLRAFDYFLLGKHDMAVEGAFWANLKGFVRDIQFVLLASFPLLFLYVPLSKLSARIANIILYSFYLIYFLLEISLSQYFFTNFQLLGSELMKFSANEIFQIVGPEAANISIVKYGLWTFLFGGFVFLGLRWKKLLDLRLALAYLLVALVMFVVPLGVNSDSKTASLKESLTYSKVHYLTYQCLHDQPRIVTELSFKQALEKYRKVHVGDYVDTTYPMLRAYDDDIATLAPFFKDTTVRPNVVVIIFESMARKFSGPIAFREWSFTPFMDSLASEGLYWENCMSTAEKTYGVLPATLGALPAGLDRGFINQGYDMPLHSSILWWAKNQGYKTSYLFGGWMGFDKMNHFFRKQGTDYIMDEHSFSAEYQKEKSKNSWGFEDKETFEMSFKYMDSLRYDTFSYMNVYLTLSMHSPYKAGKTEVYRQKMMDIIKESGGDIHDERYCRARDYVMKCAIYDDEALRDFFEAYQQRPEFGHTIFIITGDHNPSVPFQQHTTDKFHVPLLIYSPLLKRAGSFKKVVSHLDVTPSLVALLSAKYGMQAPEQVTWLGKSLDTARIFGSDRQLFFQNVGGELVYGLDGYRFWDGTKYKLLKEDMELEEDSTNSDDSPLFMDVYKMINDHVCRNDLLLDKEQFVKLTGNKALSTLSANFEGEHHQQKGNTQEQSKSGDYSYRLDDETVYEVAKFDVTASSKYHFIRTKFSAFSEMSIPSEHPSLVWEAIVDGKVVQTVKNDMQRTDLFPRQWNEVALNLDVDLDKSLPQNAQIRIYIRTSKDYQFYIDDLEVSVFGN